MRPVMRRTSEVHFKLRPETSERDSHSANVFFRQVFPVIMLPMFLGVMDQTIVANALPALAPMG